MGCEEGVRVDGGHFGLARVIKGQSKGGNGHEESRIYE
jgi:hypothetical protein